MITKTAEKARRNSWMFKNQGAPDVSSDQVVNHMKAKYSINPQVIPIHNPDMVNASFMQDTDGKARAKVKKGLSFQHKILSNKIDPLNTERRKGIAEALKGVSSQKSGDLIMADKQLLANNPEVIAHEMGHGVNHRKKFIGKIYRNNRKPLATLAPIALQAAGGAMKNPNLVLAGAGLEAARQGSILADEYTASRKAKSAMKELGSKRSTKTLNKAFWGSYAPSAAISTAVPTGMGLRLRQLAKAAIK